MHVVYAQGQGVLLSLLRQVPGNEPGVPVAPGLPAVLREQHPDGRDGDREAARIPGPRADRVQREPAEPGMPVLAARLLPHPTVELPGQAAVAALEQRGGVDTRVEEPVLLARRDDPDALDAGLRTLGQPRTVGLLPLPRRVVRHEHARAELAVRHARQVPAGPWIADRELDHLSREGPRRYGELPFARTPEHEEPLLGPDEDLRLIPAARAA